MAEARDSPARPRLSLFKRGDRGPSEVGKWFAANSPTVFMLLLIFILALFVRSYFAWEMSADNGYIVSGGSDSYYWRRIIDFNVETGDQLYWDPLINFPDGIRNPRPPLYSFSVAVPAVFLQDLFGSLDDSVGTMFVWSTAIWGALTVFPVYLLGKETFGRRAGLVAAFFLALMPSHVQRSVLSNADHDAFILFFIVLTFYFLLRAIEAQNTKRWVENWKSFSSIRAGFRDYFANSKRAILFALMAGTAYGCIIMIWVGFAYVTVLILAYYLIQVLFNRFRNVDSFSVSMIIFISLGFGYLISFPVYYEQSLVAVRFDIPVYLWLAALIFGFLFVITRDYPWTLTLPAIGALFAVGIIGVSIIDPTLADAILSGQGYFVKSKLYSTIAEARAPQFSELALSFGLVTFFMSLIGLVWAMIKVPKKPTAPYILMVVWLAAAIFMAISAGRFMFNAAPAFAISAAWILVIIVDALDFNSVRRSIMGASGSFLHVFKKSVKIRHIVGALFLVFMIVLPNVWHSVDAAIPVESKRSYDRQIYYSLPSFMRPGDYDAINGSNWYFGAFGYSLPLPSQYFPAAWSWFSSEDQDIYPETARPAYVSWWDYGFEAVEEGKHPTVADNFQNGYQLTGNVIMAQSEEDAIAIFAYRLINTAIRHEPERSLIMSLFDEYGISWENMSEIISGPAKPLIDEVLGNPEIYGPMASDLSDVNARIVMAREELKKIGVDELVEFYDELCDVTGWSIRYFNVDARMFPISGTNTGIFYAPAKLSDRRIDEEKGSVPIDFYKILAVDQYGITHELDDIGADDVIVNYKLEYQDMFWDSMFYRAMGGFSGSDIGLNDTSLPGMTGALQKYNAMPGWNMTHFRVVYRTAYFNPYSTEEVAEHPEAWRAISYELAEEYKAKIQAGEMVGSIDESSYNLYTAGTTFLKYYHGAFLNGTVTTEQGLPAAGVRVTVQDEYGIPHDWTTTDKDGHYSLLAPFGNGVKLVFSSGISTTPSLTAANVIATLTLNITDAQAMRVKQDLDGNGIYDYIITQDYVMRGSQLTADIFWDINGDGNYTTGMDEFMTDVTVVATELNSGNVITVEVPDGSLETYVPPGRYKLTVKALGTELVIVDETAINAGVKSTQKLAVEPAGFTGNLSSPDGTPLPGLEIVMTDVTTGYQYTATSEEDGSFEFPKLLEGRYSITVDSEALTLFNQYVGLSGGFTTQRNMTVYEKAVLNYRIAGPSGPLPYATYMVVDYYDSSMVISGSADVFGMVSLELPAEGLWTLYATYADGYRSYANMRLIDTSVSSLISGTLELVESKKVTGALKDPKGIILRDKEVFFQAADGSRVAATTNSLGNFELKLPPGTYEITSWDTVTKGMYSGALVVEEDVIGLSLKMNSAVVVSGLFIFDSDSDGAISSADAVKDAPIIVTDVAGRRFTLRCGEDGTFRLVMPKGLVATMSTGLDGYTGWSFSVAYTSDASDVRITAVPDNATVQGYVRVNGVGVRNVEVVFSPVDYLVLPQITAVTGANGFYSVDLKPADYTVTIRQDVTPIAGQQYQLEKAVTIEPSGSPVTLDLDPVVRVEVFGNVLGAAYDIEVRFVGPEEKTLDLTLFNYSTYLLPGTYQVYASGSLGIYDYARMFTADVSIDSREYDIQLTRAYTLSGTITLEGETTSKQVTVTAESINGGTVTELSKSTSTYSISLPEGTYVVSFVLEDSFVEGTQTIYAEYFYETTLVMGSSAVSLNPDLDLLMDNTTFSGVVVGPDGSPMQAEIQLLTNGRYGLSTTIYTGSSGAFSAQVQPGEYTVYVKRYEDRRVALDTLRLSRNVPLTETIQLSEGKYLSGRVTVGNVPEQLPVSLTSSGAKLTLTPDSEGYFSAILPQGEYSLSASTTKVEAGMTVAYNKNTDATVGANDVFVDLSLTRDTKRSVTMSWNTSLTQAAMPGATVSYAFTIKNTGNIADKYTLSSTSSNFEVTFSESPVSVDFGTNGNTEIVVVTIKVGTNLVAGNTEVKVSAKSTTFGSVRAELKLYVNVLESHSVDIVCLNESQTVSGRTTTNKFTLNNTGNAADSFRMSITNVQELALLGWTAKIIDSTTGSEVKSDQSIEVEAFSGKEFRVEFTSTRADASPVATATVHAYSEDDASVSTYGSVQVILPDLVIGPGDIEAERGDISYTLDTSRVMVDIVLVMVLGALIATFFIMRRRKGLGGGGKK